MCQPPGVADTLEPVTALIDDYAQAYQRYQALYPLLHSLNAGQPETRLAPDKTSSDQA
ncbi:MAG: hypothetical protein R3E89_19905 [Thiolinea sp.]